MTTATAIDKFLRALGIYGEEQDTMDIEYLQQVHWELWEKFNYQITDVY